ncbi:3-oxoadipate enol-lactonase [Corynebacterium sp. H128]|uniref:3-oxoadipate enol-lactonase n=1 Tax=Corynebacterium sp. H128 TaxID=3133427 RepID=UPI0030B408E6
MALAQLHVREFGTGGTPLVLLGSLGSSIKMWLHQLDYFSASRRVIAVDLRGHGKSDVVPGSTTIDELAADVLAAVDAPEFDLVGLSLGGGIAQHIALAHADHVRRLVLVSTAPKFGDSAGWQQKAADVRAGKLDELSQGTIERWFSPTWLQSHPASREYWRQMVADTPAEGYAAACTALAAFDTRERLASLSKPTLVVAGTQDTSTPPEVVQQLAAGIPDARYEEFNPAAHLLNVERAAEFNALLEDFLS